MKKGIFICFIGTDGSGKTTHAKNLNKYLTHSMKSCKYIWCGWRGIESFLFRPILKFMKTFYNPKVDNMSNHKKNSDIFSCIALFDYVIRVIPDIVFSIYRYDYIVADRFIYDVIIGFSVYSNKETNLFSKICWLFPKPDKTFFIDVPEHIAYGRKNDIPSIEYLSKQRVLYKRFLNEYDIERIDGTKSVEDILDIIKSRVTKIER